MKPIEDISKLAFTNGTLREFPGKYNFVSLVQRALDDVGVAYPNSGAASKTDILPSVTDISTYSDPTTSTIFVEGQSTGGQFYIYTGIQVADGGIIFTDADGNKWKRIIQDKKVNILWYGASPSAAAVDNYTAITAARDYIWTNPTEADTVFIPAGLYDVSETIYFTQSIKILGEGVTYTPSSRLRFPWNTTGIFFSEPSFDFTCEMKNISVENSNDVSPADETKAAIEIRCQVLFDNVCVPFASGTGINIKGCLNSVGDDFGDTDYSKFYNCKVTEALNGFTISGCDSNHMSFYNCWAQANVRWGIYDDSFLGCQFFACQFAGNSNASLSRAHTTVNYNGINYTATTLSDDGSNVNKRPDLFPAYWTVAGAIANDNWDDTTSYHSGGCFASVNASGASEWYSPYVEGDQPGSIMNTRSMTFGGVRGAYLAGVGINASLSSMFLSASNVIIPSGHLVIGALEPNPSPTYTSLEVHKAPGETFPMKVISDSPFSQIAFVTSGGSGSVGVYQDLLWLLSNNGIVMRIVPEYADNAAAILAGKPVDYVYRTGDFLKIVH